MFFFRAFARLHPFLLFSLLLLASRVVFPLLPGHNTSPVDWMLGAFGFRPGFGVVLTSKRVILVLTPGVQRKSSF